MRREWNKCGSRTWNHAVLVFYTVFFYTGFLHLHATDVCSSCHINATCTTKNGTKTCDCNYGFFGNGITFCSDKDECQIGSERICGLHAACYNTHGSYYCTCNEGYKPSNNMDLFTPNDGTHCTAINCGTSPILQNTLRYPPVNTTYGNTVTYQCAHGYEYVTGNTSLICSTLGHWEGQHLECEVIDCGSPPVLENTVQLPLENTTYDSTVTYKCLTGYVYAGGNTMLACSAQGQWEGLKLECKAVNCGSPPVLPNTVRYLPGNTTYGSTVNYHCVDGHIRVTGNSSLLCSVQGQWEGPKLECEAVNCGSPPVLPNTVRYLPGNTTYGSTVNYHCVDGHIRVTGNSSLLCSVQGQWEGPKLECEAVNCGSPPVLPNTVRYLPGNTTYGSTVKYHCVDGHIRVTGNSSLLCSAQGQWEGPKLECEAVNCGSPPVLPNTVRYLPGNTTYGSTVNYHCVDGHIRVTGNSSLLCSAQGQWEGPKLECEAVNCGSPPVLPNTVRYLPGNTTYGSTVNYHCVDGHIRVTGNSSLLCSAQGQWEGPKLECEAVNCGSPPVLPNTVRYLPGNTTYGSTVNYHCVDGHIRVTGNSSLLCSAQGQWEGPKLECEAVNCGSPPVLPNTVRYLPGNTTYGSTVKYHCVDGHIRVTGNSSLLCSAQGQWEGPKLECEAVDCGSPPDLQNTKHYMPDNTTYGSMVKYQCLTGYQRLRGNDTLVCSSQGQWEGPDLECKAVDCGSAPELQNAVRYSLGNTTYGSTVEYQCLAGHVRLRGNGALVCSARGQWEGPDLECEAVDCGSPPAIANTLRNPPPNTTYGSTAVYQCLPGFHHVRGNSALVCSARGLWEGQSMNCQVVDCGSPPSLENTLQYPPRNTTYGSKTKYTCLAGYLYIRGNTTLVCSAQGQWEGARLECEAVDCGTPAPIPNAWSLHVRVTTYGTEIQYRCKTGFVRGGGNGTMICSETGQWEGAHFNCSAVDCGTPAPIPNAWSLRVRGTTYGTEIQYRCKTGFVREGGNGTMICSETGQWEGAHFNCSEIDCGIPPVVPHAKMASYHSTRLGSVAHYRCRDGFYAVSGSNVSTCKQEGQWEEITLVCQVNDFIPYNKSCLKWKRDGLGTRSEDTYLFQIQGERVYQREFFYKKLFNYSTADDSPAICLDLQAGTNYTVNITALTSHHSACIQLSTAVTDPPIPDIQVLVVEQILPPLILRRVESKNGPISLYQVIVLPLNLQHSFNCNSQNIRDFFDHQKDTEAYITAEFIAMDVKDGMQFSVGDRLYYRDFYNAALEAGKNYSFLLKIISEWNYVKKQSCVTLAQLKGVSRQDNSRDAKYYIVAFFHCGYKEGQRY
ncbi:sushi, von Willebrand factor type A, EGF and pentraxin domain-containing protein 1 isoform X4 [Mobula birostris]|uniref:sushi, von Willebrand factor type A, EGF and pentraxin domain-containing protein 1 isoform X4 n=1 Tax=Mobula birostris TaxID=1983395 RepID=UPI003B27B53F